jgi:hypothetical protein
MKSRFTAYRVLAILVIVSFLSMMPGYASPADAAGFAVVGNGTAASCTEAALDAALVLAPVSIGFNCGAAAVTIPILNQKTISSDVTIDGGTKITLSGVVGNPTRLFAVNPGARLYLYNLTITQFNAGAGDGGAILNLGTTRLVNGTISASRAHSGGAIFNGGGLGISEATLSGNIASFMGGAIFNAAGATLDLTNVTLSGNNGPNGGGGLLNEGGSAVLTNVTVFNNSADGGGSGIFNINAAGTVSILNTIVAKNKLASNCTGTITSKGHNLSSDGTCASMATDLKNTDPLLQVLANYGGYTLTHRPQTTPSLSPAVDAGTNTSCPTQDQRGMLRPFGLACDIGAVEIQAGEMPDTSNGPWYVSPSGLDTNSCNVKTEPCLTINGAIAKAQDQDLIYVATGTYTGSGAQVVLANKSVGILGGWDSGFTSETGMSTIDGQYSRRGISVPGNATLWIYNFIVENGNATNGGGAYVEGTLQGSQMAFQNNHAFSGGGVYLTRTGGSFGALYLWQSGIYNNFVTGSGGGIFLVNGSSATLVNVTVSNNSFLPSYPDENGFGGGIFIQSGTASLNQVTVAQNTAVSGIYLNAGAIFTSNTIFADICDGNIANITSFGHNMEWFNTCHLNLGTDHVNTPPDLGPLQNNGGPTLTNALLYSSPAIDAASSAFCPTNDQRLVKRPYYNACDIGAYEYNGIPVSIGMVSILLKFPLGLSQSRGILSAGLGANSYSSPFTLEYLPRDLPSESIGVKAALKSFEIYAFCDGSVCPSPASNQASVAAVAPISQLNTPMTLSIPYSAAELSADGVSASSLHILVKDTKTNTWHEIPSTVDAANFVVIAHTTLLGEFVLVGGPHQIYLPLIRH